MQTAQRLHWIRIFAVIGLFISAFLTYTTYQDSATSFCLLGDYFDCALLKSPYATLGGISHFLTVDLGSQTPLYSLPIANTLLFFLVFLYVFIVGLQMHAGQPVYGMQHKKAAFVTKLVLYLAAIYSIYLTYVETYILYSFCILCSLLTILIFVCLWFFIGLHLSFITKTTRSKPRTSQKRRARRRK